MSLRNAAAERGIDVKIKMGAPGQLQVFRDGTKLYDYKEAGQRMLSPDQFLGLIHA